MAIRNKDLETNSAENVEPHFHYQLTCWLFFIKYCLVCNIHIKKSSKKVLKPVTVTCKSVTFMLEKLLQINLRRCEVKKLITKGPYFGHITLIFFFLVKIVFEFLKYIPNVKNRKLNQLIWFY